MRRWTLRILVCLILGAITTVAVAWGFAWFAKSMALPLRVQYERLAPEAQHWHVSNTTTQLQPTLGTRISFPGETISFLLAPEPVTVGGRAGMIHEQAVHAFGFPMRSMVYVVGGTVSQQTGVQTTSLHGSLTNNIPPVFVDSQREWRNIPGSPIWPGFVIDTLFYAAIWGGVWFGFVGIRRFVRRKRGRCPRCGYDLRGNLDSGCSECGWGRAEPPL